MESASTMTAQDQSSQTNAAVDLALRALDQFTPDQLRAALDRHPHGAVAALVGETTVDRSLPVARVVRDEDDDAEAHNFNNLMRILNYLIQHRLLITPYTEDSHGPMAPAENFIASIDALRLRASLAPQQARKNAPNIADELDFMSLLACSSEDIRSRDKWAKVVQAINAWYIREAEAQRQSELEQGWLMVALPAHTKAEAAPLPQMSATDRALALSALEWLYDRARPTFGRLLFADEAIKRLKGE